MWGVQFEHEISFHQDCIAWLYWNHLSHVDMVIGARGLRARLVRAAIHRGGVSGGGGYGGDGSGDAQALQAAQGGPRGACSARRGEARRDTIHGTMG